MINCSRLSLTTEETRSWQPNNISTRGLVFNTRTALGRSLQLVPFKETSLAQAPLPLGLGYRSCSVQRNKPRSRASPTGTRQSLLFRSKEQASLKRLSHWDSTFAQMFPQPTRHKSRLATHINVHPDPCGTYFTSRI
ncbi:hypothetical protein Adt_46578 [Abeliophyllum distichum]|uniref:Uncharacterized protein n=1 Tax=Abeliophyllum distichum TaxID=126358 RepID=A0ABD1NZ67_9LAMI